MSSAAAAPMTGPVVDDDGVVFVLADRYRRLAAVRLVHELGSDGAAFTRERTQWWLQLPRPPVDRMEYLFEIEDHNGHRTTITDPGNPLRAPGAFGDKSVVEFPGYAQPSWLTAATVDGSTAAFEIDAPLLDATVTGEVWSPDGLDVDTAAPLLLVHDGPEFAALGHFVHYIAASIASGLVPPVRVALLGPGERNAWYAANPAYAETLVDTVLPALPSATRRIGIGVSLGALAMLHVHRRFPAALDGLLLQSGSFFTADLDAQEAQFSGFAPVTEFVASVHDATDDRHPVPTVLTCGFPEENRANNQRMAATLLRLGYPSELAVVRDSHNYTAWRDALHPHLAGIITTVVGADAT